MVSSMPPEIALLRVRMHPEAVLAATGVLESGYIGEGTKVHRFERRLSAALDGVHHVVLTNSGTSALELAFELLGLKRGDEVVTTPMTCVATNVGLLRRGCRILWADCDPRSGMIDPDSVATLVTRNTRAVVTVDWAGEVSPISRLRHLRIPIVQDAAHSFAPLLTPPAHDGTAAEYVIWSFQAVKYITAVDGGALLLRDAQEAHRGRLLRWYGLDRSKPASSRLDQDMMEPGYKWHMNDVAASIAEANLLGAERAVALAQGIAAVYDEELNSSFEIARPTGPTSRWLYTAKTPNPARLIRHLKTLGIEAAQVHRRNDELTPFAEFRRPLPGVDAYAAQYVAIPCGWWMDAEDVERVVTAMAIYAQRYGG